MIAGSRRAGPPARIAACEPGGARTEASPGMTLSSAPSCLSATLRPAPAARRTGMLRGLGCLAVLALLAACGTTQQGARQEAAGYARHARGDYTPPGPPGDPWGPYIVEASRRFDVPQQWIREVMRVESGGQLYINGQLTTSPVGAMGLMQVMPATYDELRAQYALGDDPYDPRNNILAGTAYLRQMYDLYGSPGFLAAYNAGPGRLEDYLMRNRSLPDETRRYVARIAPNIEGAQPAHVSQAAQLAMYQLPDNIPPGPRYPRGRRAAAPVALAQYRAPSGLYSRAPVQTAALPPPPPRPAPVRMAAAAPPAPRGFHLIAPAMADTMPNRGGGSGDWAIQVGAFGNAEQAHAAAIAARIKARGALAEARPFVGTVHQARATLYRARLTGLTHERAREACRVILSSHGACIVLSPEAQS